MYYLFLMQRKELTELAADEANAKKLWKLSEELIKEQGVEI